MGNLVDELHKVMDWAEAEARKVFGSEAGEVTEQGKDLLGKLRGQLVDLGTQAEQAAKTDLSEVSADVSQDASDVATNVGTATAADPTVAQQPGAPA